jgi:hypothetical protein
MGHAVGADADYVRYEYSTSITDSRGNDHLQDLGINGRIILKLVSVKEGVKG